MAITHHTVPGGRAWPLVVLGQRFMPQAAAIRSLRHRLVEKGDPRVVLVTSAARKEGKTFCAANLALALAEIRRSRVLLLEANVYHPSLASLFGLRQVPCFLEQLEAHRRDFMAPWKVAELSHPRPAPDGHRPHQRTAARAGGGDLHQQHGQPARPLRLHRRSTAHR